MQITAPSIAELRSLPHEELIEHYEVLGDNFEIVNERLAELELALEDVGWQQFAIEGEAEFSRSALAKIIRASRVMSIKNPLIRRSVEVPVYYVWGQGVSINAAYKPLNAFIQAILDDDGNRAEFSSSEAQQANERELRSTGNLFIALFPDYESGFVAIRTLPIEEVPDIITNPQDRTEAWYILRKWTERTLNEFTGQTETLQRTAYYPTLRYWRKRNGDFPPTIGGKTVMRAPVRHVKVGGLKPMRFGVPETYAAIDWAQAAKADLEDYATIRRALARYAWIMQMAGAGKRKVDAAEQRISARINNTGGADTNPPRAAGATYIAGEGVNMQPMQTRGATPDPEGARRMWLMVASASGLPETFFGDADVGNHATSKTLDRPTELQFRLRQTLWVDVTEDILQFCVDVGIQAPGNELDGDVGADFFGREVLVLPIDPESEGQTPYSRHIDVEYPPLLEHDAAVTVGAIVDAATLKGHPDAGILPPKHLAEMLLSALGEDDIDEILKTMFDKDGNLINPPEPAPSPGQEPGQQPPANARPTDLQASQLFMLAEAVRELRETLQKIAEPEGAEV